MGDRLAYALAWSYALRAYALAFPANSATAAQTANPGSNEFVMIVPSFVVQRRMLCVHAATLKIASPAARATKLAFKRLNSSLMLGAE
jgi:hypothetical protein